MKARSPRSLFSRLSHASSSHPVRHPPVMLALHWLLAALIIAALVMSAFVMPDIRNDSPEKIDALRRHMSVGALVFLLTFARLSVRRRASRPAFLSSGMAWADRLARAVHRVFDLLVLAMVSSGIGMAVLGGIFPAAFGLSKTLPADFASLPLHTLHRSVGITLFVLLALHVGGALYHQIVLRDGLLSRMGLGFARR